jgi:uncharacterized SAM-binding protein YcdF (DUF218 family)
VEVKKIVGADRFLLVTAGFHLRRSVAVARRLGMKPVAAPAAIWAAQRFPAGLSWRAWSGTVLELAGRPSPKRLVYVQWASHEHLGYVWYWMLGRL